MRIWNEDRGYLKLRSWPFIDVLIIPPEDISWVPYAEDATLFFWVEEEVEHIAALVAESTGLRCEVVEYRSETGYFVIEVFCSLGVYLKDGSWTYAHADLTMKTREEILEQSYDDYAVWLDRSKAQEHLNELFIRLEKQYGQDPAKANVFRQDWRVRHVADLYGVDPAIWEAETQGPQEEAVRGESIACPMCQATSQAFAEPVVNHRHLDGLTVHWFACPACRRYGPFQVSESKSRIDPPCLNGLRLTLRLTRAIRENLSGKMLGLRPLLIGMGKHVKSRSKALCRERVCPWCKKAKP